MSNLTRLDPLDDFFRGFFVRPVDFGHQNETPPSIKMDVKEKPQAYLVHAELPGVKKEDIHVLIEGNQVSISAETKQQKDVKEGERTLRSERYFGKVSRTFQLASEIDEGKSLAKFNDGVLELSLPKKASVASRKLAID